MSNGTQRQEGQKGQKRNLASCVQIQGPNSSRCRSRDMANRGENNKREIK